MSTRYAGTEKVESTSVSLPPSFMAYVRKRAIDQYKGNKSAVFVEALEKAFPEITKGAKKKKANA